MTNRRSFLKQASLAFAPFILPSHIWSAKGDTSPNNRINIAIIGPGKMGRGHAHKLIRNPRAQLTGFAEIADVRTQHTKELIEKHYSKNTPGDQWKGLKITKDYLELLEDKSLDAVLIATPDHWHGEATIRAARAKKHVYCEKPISLTIKEGRAMANAVKENGVVFQTGSQQRTEYGGKFRRTVELVRSGAIGELKKIRVCVGAPPKTCDLPTEPIPEGIDWDAWLGPAPKRGFNKILCPDDVHNHFPAWRNYREYCNGKLADIGAHHFDIGQWAMDADDTGPVKILPPEEGESELKLIYANGVEVIHGRDPEWNGGTHLLRHRRHHLGGPRALEIRSGKPDQGVRGIGDLAPTEESPRRLAGLHSLRRNAHGSRRSWSPHRLHLPALQHRIRTPTRAYLGSQEGSICGGR